MNKFKYLILSTLSILTIIIIIYSYSDNFRKLSYNIVDHYLYDGPPIYSNKNFKNKDPNTVCQYLKNHNLNAGSYKRQTYFEYECRSLNRISPQSTFSNQYFVSGDKYHVKKIKLIFKIIKNNDLEYLNRLKIQMEELFNELEIPFFTDEEFKELIETNNFIKNYENNIYFSFNRNNNEILVTFE